MNLTYFTGIPTWITLRLNRRHSVFKILCSILPTRGYRNGNAGWISQTIHLRGGTNNRPLLRQMFRLEHRKKLPCLLTGAFGTRGGSRTHTAFRPGDFKSPAYAIPPPGQSHQVSTTFARPKLPPVHCTRASGFLALLLQTMSARRPFPRYNSIRAQIKIPAMNTLARDRSLLQ